MNEVGRVAGQSKAGSRGVGRVGKAGQQGQLMEQGCHGRGRGWARCGGPRPGPRRGRVTGPSCLCRLPLFSLQGALPAQQDFESHRGRGAGQHDRARCGNGAVSRIAARASLRDAIRVAVRGRARALRRAVLPARRAKGPASLRGRAVAGPGGRGPRNEVGWVSGDEDGIWTQMDGGWGGGWGWWGVCQDKGDAERTRGGNAVHCVCVWVCVGVCVGSGRAVRPVRGPSTF